MSISIYYTAFRDRDLSADERQAVAAVQIKYSVNAQIEEYLKTGEGLNWESFIFYEPPLTPGAVIEGATRLPDNSEDKMWFGLQHWCRALSELRIQIADAKGEVHVDDHDIQWDESQQAYDPTK